jgi:hypothetical protein
VTHLRSLKAGQGESRSRIRKIENRMRFNLCCRNKLKLDRVASRLSMEFVFWSAVLWLSNLVSKNCDDPHGLRTRSIFPNRSDDAGDRHIPDGQHPASSAKLGDPTSSCLFWVSRLKYLHRQLAISNTLSSFWLSHFPGTCPLLRCGGRRSLKSIARLGTFVLSSSYLAIQSWRAPSVISGLK